MLELIVPRFVAMDSSQLGDWCGDKFSKDSTRRDSAAQFERALSAHGLVVLLCWHHFEELLSIQNMDTAANRVRGIRSLPLVAWPKIFDGRVGLGNIVDIVGAELQAALSLGNAGAIEVRDAVAKNWLTVGSGEQAVAPYENSWRELQPIFSAREKRTREIVAITRSKSFDISDVKINDLLDGKMRLPEDAIRAVGTMLLALATDITAKGDARIENPLAIAGEFFSEVVKTANPAPTTARDLVLRGLSLMEIDLSDIGPKTTLREVNRLAIFRGHMKTAADTFDLPWLEIKKCLRMDQIPSLLVQNAIRQYGQELQRSKGSDMTDGYLASLACYANVTYVDKRTMENVRRASKKSEKFNALVRCVKKASPYKDIPQQIIGSI